MSGRKRRRGVTVTACPTLTGPKWKYWRDEIESTIKFLTWVRAAFPNDMHASRRGTPRLWAIKRIIAAAHACLLSMLWISSPETINEHILQSLPLGISQKEAITSLEGIGRVTVTDDTVMVDGRTRLTILFRFPQIQHSCPSSALPPLTQKPYAFAPFLAKSASAIPVEIINS